MKGSLTPKEQSAHHHHHCCRHHHHHKSDVCHINKLRKRHLPSSMAHQEAFIPDKRAGWMPSIEHLSHGRVNRRRIHHAQ